MTMFIDVGRELIHRDMISRIDIGMIEDLIVVVHAKDGATYEVVGLKAIDVVMCTKPSALESKRLRWHKYVWMVHNMIGHPMMQVLAFLKRYDLAMRVHDATVPRPKGRRIER